MAKALSLFLLIVSSSLGVFAQELDTTTLPHSPLPSPYAPPPHHHHPNSPLHSPTHSPLHPPVHPPHHHHHHHHPPAPAPVPAKPPTHHYPPTPAPAKPPTHHIYPPTPAPAKPPTHHIYLPTPAPAKPPTHHIYPPTPAPLKPPTHHHHHTPAPAKPPTHHHYPPGPAPVHPPPPVHPFPRSFIAVQGVVYTKSCKYAGVDTLLAATPLLGAVVKLECNNTRYRPLVQTVKTDKNGYFYLEAPKTITTYAFHKCKVFLVSSPTGLKPSNLHGGLQGSLLKPEKPFVSKKLPFLLFNVGPLAFEPKCPY